MAVTLAQIKADQLQARKDKDAVKASLLTTLIGEIENKLKGMQGAAALDGGSAADVKETEIVAARIKTFLKSNKESQEYMATSEIHPVAVELNLSIARAEEAILTAYLPQQLSAEQIEQILTDNFQVIDAKMRGQVMLYLKANYAGQYDGKVASDVVSNLITAA